MQQTLENFRCIGMANVPSNGVWNSLFRQNVVKPKRLLHWKSLLLFDGQPDNNGRSLQRYLQLDCGHPENHVTII